MNWLGWSTRAFFGALLGAGIGGWLYAVALQRGLDVPFVVGALMGLGAWLLSPDRSGMRGLLLAIISLWIAWAVQAVWGPHASAGLAGFHATLTWKRWLAFGACAALAFLLARSSAQSGRRRIAGA